MKGKVQTSTSLNESQFCYKLKFNKQLGSTISYLLTTT